MNSGGGESRRAHRGSGGPLVGDARGHPLLAGGLAVGRCSKEHVSKRGQRAGCTLTNPRGLQCEREVLNAGSTKRTPIASHGSLSKRFPAAKGRGPLRPQLPSHDGFRQNNAALAKTWFETARSVSSLDRPPFGECTHFWTAEGMTGENPLEPRLHLGARPAIRGLDAPRSPSWFRLRSTSNTPVSARRSSPPRSSPNVCPADDFPNSPASKYQRFSCSPRASEPCPGSRP